ncbi:alpha/beta fold hydrolase [Dokdonella sp.]|uniref:S9 family peptidase n=1 Tax=Dokdonella sp. TaxID=2291710 RepID=UPI00352789E8
MEQVRMRLREIALFIALLLTSVQVLADPLPLADFARHMQFRTAKIAPDGKHLAATSVIDGKVVLSVIDLDKNTGVTLRPREDDEVFQFWWVSNTRIVYTVAQNIGYFEAPGMTGELFAVDVDGKNKDILFGYRVSQDMSGSLGSHITKKQSEYASAWMLDALRDNDEEALIQVRRWNWSHVGSAGGESLPEEVRVINVKTGKNRTIAVSPITGSRFVLDNNGGVRFAYGEDKERKLNVYYRAANDAEWELIFTEADDGNRYVPVYFNRAGDGVYFECPGRNARGGVCLWDTKTRTFSTLWSGKEAGPNGYEQTFDEQDLFAIRSMPGRTSVTLIDKNADEAHVLVDMLQQFPGSDVHFINATRDGKKVVLSVESDRDPGAFYLYDVDSRKLSFLLARAPWIKPEDMAVMEPFSIKARDGVELHGFLTKPPGKEDARDLPMVVFVHGGPYWVRDTWEYDPYVQVLASRGYAVLQVNFRGSGGYGDAFITAGFGEWGARMQDDVTDATHWAIKQGDADPKRICIFGGSYGGYAALQGAVREPDLYQCTIGYVGVYDLRLMKSRGDIPQSLKGGAYLDKVLGSDDTVLAQRSPINQLDRLKADVMLIVGGQDKRVPPIHSENLRSALGKRGIEVEWLYQPTEGHGYYDESNVTEMYEKLIAFLDRNIGEGASKEVEPEPKK